MSSRSPDVLIIGGGPAGLGAARALETRGIENVCIVEREPAVGGIPRFCPHPTFGLTDYFRPMSGPAYARRLAGGLGAASVLLNTTVTALAPDLTTTLSTQSGEQQLRPRCVLLATGIRETPRAARLVSGGRPRNILTTGALQRMVACGERLPFRRPIIVGSELVSFSAVLTLRDHGIRAVAMLESEGRVQTLQPAKFGPALLGTPVLTARRLLSINAAQRDASNLRSVTVADAGGTVSEIDCDSVIFTGLFVPEASLLAGMPDAISIGSRGPAVDQCWRLALPGMYAAGNVLRSVETAAWSAREGAAAGHAIADDILSTRVNTRRIPIVASGAVKLVIPSAISFPGPELGPLHMMLRMKRSAHGRLVLSVDGVEAWRSRTFTAHPERRIRITRHLPPLDRAQQITVGFEEQRG